MDTFTGHRTEPETGRVPASRRRVLELTPEDLPMLVTVAGRRYVLFLGPDGALRLSAAGRGH